MSFTDQDLNTYPAVNERDADTALVIALRVSERVQALFRKAAGIESRELVSVCRSLREDNRETDVEVRFGDPASPFKLQIENKITARLGKGQAEAYAGRAARAEESDAFAGGRSLLCAPQGYLDRALDALAHFDGSVSYEDVRNLLLEEEPWGRELALILECALRQHCGSGTQAPPDPWLTEQLHEFSRYAAEVGIPVPDNGGRSGRSYVWVKKNALQSLSNVDVQLRLDPTKGIVDLELRGAGARLDIHALQAAQPEVQVDSSPKNVYLSLEKPRSSIDIRIPIAEQIDAVTDQWARAARLRSWWNESGAEAISALVADS